MSRKGTGANHSLMQLMHVQITAHRVNAAADRQPGCDTHGYSLGLSPTKTKSVSVSPRRYKLEVQSQRRFRCSFAKRDTCQLFDFLFT